MIKHTKRQTREEYAKENAAEHDESVLNPEKKPDHDLSRREKREIEKEKLKNMGLGGKLDYIWTYYKAWIIGFLVLCFAVYEGYSLYQRSLIDTVLTVSVVNSGLIDTGALGDAIEEELGCKEDVYKEVEIYTNLTTENGDSELSSTAQMVFSTETGAGVLDILIMPEDLFGTLSDGNDIFMDLTELLGEELDQFGTQTDSTCIKVTDEELSEALGVSYEPVCIAVMINTKNPEAAADWLKSLA